MPRRFALTVAFTLASPALSTAEAGQTTMEVIAAWAGPVNGVHVEDDIAYLGSGRRVVAVDVSDINNFIELGALDLGMTVEDVAFRDGYAFVVTQTNPNAFCVVDFTDPNRPALAWSSSSLPIFPSSSPVTNDPRQIQLRGDYAYIRNGGDASSGGAIVQVNIANPVVPVVDGVVIEGGSFGVRDFQIAGDYLYVGRSGNPGGGHPAEVQIYDIGSAPASPTLLGGLFLPADAQGAARYVEHLTVSGDTIYALVEYLYEDPFVIDLYDRFVVIDATDKSRPVLVDSTADLFNLIKPTDIVVQGTKLYVAHSGYGWGGSSVFSWANSTGLRIYDIGADPHDPHLIKTYKTHGAVNRVRLFGDSIAWLLDAGEGLIALDVANPLAPVRRDYYHSPAHLKEMARVGDDLLVVVDLLNGFTVLNVADPAQPQVVGVYQTALQMDPLTKTIVNKGAANWGIAVRDNLVYLTTGWSGVQVVNIANPANPIKVGSYALIYIDPMDGSVHDLRAAGIELQGDLLHVGSELPNHDSHYHILDASDVTLPTVTLSLVGHLMYSAREAHAIALRGGYAYLACDHNFGILDVDPPSSPSVVSFATDPNPKDVAVQGNYLYLAAGQSDPTNGFYIYDVSRTPTVPDFQDFYPAPFANGVAVTGEHAYVLGYFGSPACMLFDVADRDSSQPLAVAHHVADQSYAAILVDEPHVYITDGEAYMNTDKGLIILAVDFPEEPAEPGDLNGDGVVNGMDLAMLLGQWTGSSFYSPCPPHVPADLSHDCRVNGTDLAVMLGLWG